MTKEHAIQAYKHYKDLLENPKYAGHKKVWKKNIQHGLDSIKAKFERKNIDIDKIISEEKEPVEEKPTKSKKEK